MSNENYVTNVQVEIMDSRTDEGLALDSQYAMAILKDAGVPIRNMPVDTVFIGSYLVDVDAVWYTQLGDSGEFAIEGTYAGYHYAVSVSRG